MAKSEHSKGKEKAVFIEYNEDLARTVALKHPKLLEAVGRL